MEQNMTLGKKYYAYDLSEIFEFDESITFLFVFEPKCGNLEFGDDAYSARVIKDGRVHKIENWDCSNYKNIYYLFHASRQDVTFEELIPYVNEDGASFIEPLVAFEPILQRNNVKYIERALTSYLHMYRTAVSRLFNVSKESVKLRIISFMGDENLSLNCTEIL